MAAECDLLNSVFAPETVYPWEPQSPDADAALDGLATEFDGEDIDAAIAAGWQTFSQTLDAQWGTGNTATARLVTQLTEQFGQRMPAQSLATLAAAATALRQSGQSTLDHLVACASQVLPHWDVADLGVLARPMAYSLRDGQGEVLELNLRSIPQTDWDSLSPIEQARLSLVVASVALKAVSEAEDG
jgi:hypothetical protein